MTPEAPEFHTKSGTPISPVPFHPPEPANIPVLRNQIDPVFNMTSTHLEAAESTTSLALATPPDQAADEGMAGDNDLDTSFSDPYDEEDKMPDDSQSKHTMEGAEVDDDYARTFDSDGEESSSRQDVSSENIDQKLQSLPAPVSALADDSSTLTNPATTSTIVSPDGGDNPTSHMPFPPTATTAGDAPVAVGSTALPSGIETIQSQPQFNSYEAVSNGEIDIQQILDNITANAALNATSSTNATPASANPSIPNFSPNALGLPAHASLPPRPQIAQNSPMHPGYPTQGDIRKYHAGPPNFPPPPASSYRPPLGAPPSLIAAGAPGTSTDPRNVLPPPPSASFHPVSSTGPPPTTSYPQPPDHRLSAKDQPASSIEAPGTADDYDMSWTPAVQKLYDEFLADERMYVSEGLWDRFPAGSRLFIGNLPSEQVTKRDLFYAFYRYGRLAQVSIKQAYGFVQFHDVAACQRALKGEQGQEIRGRKMHLEISKPQKNTRAAAAAAHNAPVSTRRSRSPDYMRGGIDRAIRGAPGPARGDSYDRYDSRSGVSPRDSEFRGPLRARDDYRPGRSPSPPRGSYRSREDYGSSRGYDYYDGRERRRSRSRSPYSRRENGRYRERSISPKVRATDEDADLQIPRRDPRDVPDAQIILMDELDRGFVAWVEGEMRARGIRTEVMLLSPRISLAAVIRRQILEGVLAVAQLNRRSQDTSKIPLQVFDRTGGANNVRFDEYQDLEPKIAAELVLRAKQTQSPPAPPIYAQPQLPTQPTYQTPTTTAPVPNLANLVGQLDNATLQKLLGTLNAVAPAPQVAPSANPPLDLAGILGGLGQQQPQQHSIYQSQAQPQNTYASLANNENLASLLGKIPAQAQPQGQSAQQVQNIMAQLAKFRQ